MDIKQPRRSCSVEHKRSGTVMRAKSVLQCRFTRPLCECSGVPVQEKRCVPAEVFGNRLAEHIDDGEYDVWDTFLGGANNAPKWVNIPVARLWQGWCLGEKYLL